MKQAELIQTLQEGTDLLHSEAKKDKANMFIRLFKSKVTKIHQKREKDLY
jgi:hypothetical protein